MDKRNQAKSSKWRGNSSAVVCLQSVGHGKTFASLAGTSEPLGNATADSRRSKPERTERVTISSAPKISCSSFSTLRRSLRLKQAFKDTRRSIQPWMRFLHLTHYSLVYSCVDHTKPSPRPGSIDKVPKLNTAKRLMSKVFLGCNLTAQSPRASKISPVSSGEACPTTSTMAAMRSKAVRSQAMLCTLAGWAKLENLKELSWSSQDMWKISLA